MPRGVLKAALVTQSMTIRNNNDDSKQPCLTPVEIVNGSVTDPL